jgi:uncharacterized membrane protein
MSTTAPRFTLAPRLRRAVLTVHIVASVGLLGDVAGFVAVAVRAATTADPELAAASYEILSLFSVAFGIPLSFLSLATGLLLGAGTKWGVLRYRWVTGKLLLLVSVILVGSFVLGPSTEAMRNGDGGAEALLILGAGWDVVALSLATGLSVFKPGRRRRSAQPDLDRAPVRRDLAARRLDAVAGAAERDAVGGDDEPDAVRVA